MDYSEDDVRKQTIQELLSPYHQALLGHGIGPELLARQRKKQLSAKRTKQIKLKGSIPEGTRLARGYRVIINGGVTETENGNMIFDDVLVEYRGEDWATQLRATDSLEKILNLQTETSVVEHTGSIQMTNFPPEPASMEEWEQMYQKMRDRKHDPNDPNASGE